MNAASNRARSTTRSVASKSSSVSPGKPTMMSVVTATPGMPRRIRSSHARYRSLRYDRRMARSRRSEPDCSGKWMCSHTESHPAIASTTSSVKSCGCGLVNRIRRMPSTSFTARSSSANRGRALEPGTVRSRPYVFTFWPSRVTSTTPVPGEALHLGEDVADRARALRPADERHDAERARVVASHADTETQAWWRDPRRAGSALGKTSVYSRTSICGPSASASRSSSSRPGSAWVPTTTSTHGARSLDATLVLLRQAAGHDDPQPRVRDPSGASGARASRTGGCRRSREPRRCSGPRSRSPQRPPRPARSPRPRAAPRSARSRARSSGTRRCGSGIRCSRLEM